MLFVHSCSSSTERANNLTCLEVGQTLKRLNALDFFTVHTTNIGLAILAVVIAIHCKNWVIGVVVVVEFVALKTPQRDGDI